MEKLFKVIRFENNRGHASARQAGLEASSNELVAIMDSDDLSLTDRFQKTLAVFHKNPDISVVGGQIDEFVGEQYNIIARRIVPETDVEIKQYLKSRCPMNLVSVMYKKSDVLAVGGFLDWYCEEDYYLWIRLAAQGYRFANVKDSLVSVRVGNEMYARRGGWKYFNSERRLQRYMLQRGMIGVSRYLYNVILRFGGEVLAPVWLRGLLFKLMRAKPLPIRSDCSLKIESNDCQQFSVAMSVYYKDNPRFFDAAIASIINQTVRPNEIIIVVDGLVTQEIEDVIEKYQKLWLEK